MGFRQFRSDFSVRYGRIYKVALAGWVGVLVVFVGCSEPYDTALLRAAQMSREGKCAAAVELYEKAIPRIPADAKQERAAALVGDGDCLTQQGKLREAFAAYQKAVADDAENVDAHQRLAQFMANAEQPAAAAEHAEFVLKQRPDDAVALAVLGSAEAVAGHHERAVLLLQRSLALDPQKPVVAISLAEEYAQQNKVDDARRVLTDAATDTADQKQAAFAWIVLGRLEEQEGNKHGADAAYRAAVKSDDSPLTNFRLAQFLQRSANIGEAEQVLRHLDALRPSEPSSLAEARLNAGRADDALAALPVNSSRAAAMRIEGSFAGAESKSTSSEVFARYDRMLDTTSLEVLKAELSLQRGEVRAAEGSAADALKRSPNSPAAHYVRGLVFAQQDKVAEAKEEWNSALEADADYVPAEIALANQNLKEGDLATAEKHASAVVRDEPGNLTALCVFARVLLRQGKTEAAAMIAARAQAVNVAAAEPHMVIGEIAMRQKRYGAAFLEFEHALLVEPDSPEALNGLLEVYRHGTVTPAVLQKMERVAMAPPASASLLEIAGRLYAAKGMRADAERALQMSVQADPKRQTAAIALAEVKVAGGKDDPEAFLNALASVSDRDRAIKRAVQTVEATEADKRGEFGNAIRGYESALNAGESSGVAANNLAWDYAQQGIKLDQALKLASIAVDRNPKNPAVFDTLGVVQMKRRSYSEAVASLNKAVSLMSGEEWRMQRAEVYRHLADALDSAGMADRANAARQRAEDR